MNDAVTLAVGLASVLNSVWGYYMTVIVGLAAAIGALSTATRPLDDLTKLVITAVLVLFGLFNFLSLYSTTNRLNAVIKFIANNNNDDFGKLVGGMSVRKWVLFLQPIGLIAMIYWLWYYLPNSPT